MKQTLIFLALAIPLFCMAQTLPRYYSYDDAGNRILRSTIPMNLVPPVPTDSLEVTGDGVTGDEVSEQLFIENIAQVEIKIYPNPTTEKVTLEIGNMEKLQTGNFKLISLTGQLLQEHPVHSATTTVSLSGLSKGTYILKVNIKCQSILRLVPRC